MIICPNCQASHVQGTVFCEQCGTSLIGVLPVAANPEPDSGTPFDARRPMEASQNGGAGAARAAGAVKPLPAADPADEGPSTMPLAGMQERESGRLAIGSVPTRLRVLVLNTGRLTEWIDEPVIHVGRTDRSANVFPTIDLETDGGQNAGVSRRHVRMSRQPDGYYLEDLGSINGSFLNRRRLSPGNPTELKDGDEVRLGNIVLRIVLGGFQRNQ
jgi:hypothetical protein